MSNGACLHPASGSPSPPSAVANGLSETVLLLANEPSLGLYRLQEHVRRSVPTLVELKKELTGVNMAVQGAVHDAEYAVRCVSLSPGRTDRWSDRQTDGIDG